jgi:hypothetical protein
VISFLSNHIRKRVKVNDLELACIVNIMSQVLRLCVDNLMIMYFIIVATNDEVINSPSYPYL